MYHGTISGAFKNALDWLYLLADRDPPYLTGEVTRIAGLFAAGKLARAEAECAEAARRVALAA